MEPMLRVSGLSVRYGPIEAVRNAHLEVGAGEILGLIGPNGAGKTSLLQAMVGLVGSTGAVELAAERIDGWRTERIVQSGLTLVPEHRRLFRRLTVAENLDLGGHSCRDRRLRRERLRRLLERFPILGERRDQQAGLLSGGEQQQLAICRALMGDPQVLLLDEPSLGLAPKLVERAYDLLDELRTDGLGMIVVEQSAWELLEIADRVQLMRSGELGPPRAPSAFISELDVFDAYVGTAMKTSP